MLHLRCLREVFRHRPVARKRRRPSSNAFSSGSEALEPRLLLSAAPAAEVAHASGSDLGGVGAVHEMQLRIVGTTIHFDEATGLPAYMAGEIYNSDGQLVGTYEEHLSPILHPEYGFVGTIGVSTFRFHNAQGHTTWGEVTTVNQSFITGLDENGAICVASTGQITEDTRRLSHVTGGISSSSTVILGPIFTLEVQLSLQFQAQPNAGNGGSATAPQAKGGKAHPPGPPHFTAPSAHDHAFAHWNDDLAWLL